MSSRPGERPNEPPNESSDFPRRTGRTHPPSLLKLAERTIRDEPLFGRGDVVLCACSGGPDSMALLHVLALLRRRMGHEVEAVGVDHGLRPEAASELAMAAEVAAAQGIPFRVVRVSVAQGSNLQARARSARLAALHEAAVQAGARVIATGHTADDRAETFLLRLLRGAGPRGLAVLPARAAFPGSLVQPEAEASSPVATGTTGDPGASAASPSACPIELIRPLIQARRSDVLAHLQRHHLRYAEDPSNQSARFTRVRVRREILPLLEAISPKVVEHLGALADMLGSLGRSDAEPTRLGRAQRQALDRAQRLGRSSMRLRVREGRDLDVTFPDGRIVLIEEEPDLDE